MITIAQLLELLYGARGRFQSVRATLSVESVPRLSVEQRVNRLAEERLDLFL
jgi:hypothetical protein